MTEKDLAIGDKVTAVILVTGRVAGLENGGTLAHLDLTEWIAGSIGTSQVKDVPISQIQRVEENGNANTVGIVIINRDVK